MRKEKGTRKEKGKGKGEKEMTFNLDDDPTGQSMFFECVWGVREGGGRGEGGEEARLGEREEQTRRREFGGAVFSEGEANEKRKRKKNS